MDKDQNTLYRVYLVRLWREFDEEIDSRPPLRIVLEEPQSGERRSFSSLQALNGFFAAEVDGFIPGLSEASNANK